MLSQGLLPAGTVAIGQLQLGDNDGYQTISFFNNTGASAGCGIGGSEYLACTSVDITSWTLTVDFTNENLGDPDPSYPNNLSSPLVFTGGSGDTITPFDGTTPFTGGVSGTWQIPLSFENSDEPDCGPTCDYQITEIDFSGNIDPSDLPIRLYSGQTYDGSDPSTYTTFNAASSFSFTWLVPASDYTALSDPAFFSDAADVLIGDESATPEPSTYLLVVAALLALCAYNSRKFIRALRDPR